MEIIQSPASRTLSAPEGVTIAGASKPGFEEILTEDALAFVAELVRMFRPRVRELLAARAERQGRLDAGVGFDFLPETANIREGEWTCAKTPADIQDRRVEITGPVDRKMVINALNSGANVFMADFEDATCPTWENLIAGHINLRDAIARTIRFENAGKTYALNEKVAVLFVRPRGWHLPERHVTVDGEIIPGSLFDFGLYAFHNARALVEKKSGPYFYLPKLESHLEARLWNDVFLKTQIAFGLPKGTIKATVLIETLPAAFEMDEILFELRDHSAGLNCGRWDYIFSFIKKRRAEKNAVLPDRAEVTMDKGFLRAYSERLIAICHQRGVHAMGGMAAQIPIKGDDAANEAALSKVRADKLREVTAGHDGTWVAHPALVAVAREVFDVHMKSPNQLDRKTSAANIGREELLAIPSGSRTEHGLRHNVRVGIQYIEAWLRGQGCVPLYHLMEDAATAEISRAQVWQWIHHEATITRKNGQISAVSREELATIIDEEMAVIERAVGAERIASGKFANAKKLFHALATETSFEEFLTLPAYDQILETF